MLRLKQYPGCFVLLEMRYVASMVLKKAKYHAAASILSNQVIAVLDMGYTLLEDCGFTRAEAVRATGQLVMRNIENVLEAGCDGALTGPIERNDIETVKKTYRMYAKMTIVTMSACTKCLVQNWQILLKRRIRIRIILR